MFAAFFLSATVVACAAVAVAVFRALRWLAHRPVQVTGTRTATIAAPIEAVFAIICDVGAQATWRRDLSGIRVDRTGLSWVETRRDGTEIGYWLQSRSAPLDMSASFASRKGFVGRREVRLVATGTHTKATVTETIYADRLVNRIVHQIADPPGARIARYLRDLRGAVAAAPAARVPDLTSRPEPAG